MSCVGKVVFDLREHIIALEARDNGMLGIMLLPLRSTETGTIFRRKSLTRKYSEDNAGLRHTVETKRPTSSRKNRGIRRRRCANLIEKKAKAKVSSG